MRLCQLVRRLGGWMDGRVGATAERKKRASTTLEARGLTGCFWPHLPSPLWPWLPPGSSFSSSAVFSRKMVVGEFSFWFILMHCSDNQCKCWFTKQITPACLNNGKNFSCPNLIHPYVCQGTKSAVHQTWIFTEIHITKQVKSSLFNLSCINGCLSPLPAVEKRVQADCDILRYAHYSKWFSNWFAESFPCAELESVL